MNDKYRALAREQSAAYSDHPVVEDQPPPIHTKGIPIVDLVIHDMYERKAVGIARYGTPLQAHNGRDALVDAYQEALDLVMYLRQAIEERDDRQGGGERTSP